MEQQPKRGDSEIIIDELSKKVHDIWSHWTGYFFSCLVYNKEKDCFIVPKHKYERWERQMCTEYDNLPEREKQSDIKIAKEIIEIITHKLKIPVEDLVIKDE